MICMHAYACMLGKPFESFARHAQHNNVVSIYYMVYIIVFFLYIVIHDACVCVFKKYKRHEYYLQYFVDTLSQYSYTFFISYSGSYESHIRRSFVTKPKNLSMSIIDNTRYQSRHSMQIIQIESHPKTQFQIHSHQPY